MDTTSKIFVAGASGMVGSAIIRALQANGYTNIVGSYHSRKPDPLLITNYSSLITCQLDLTNQTAVNAFFAEHRPAFVILAAAKVGGIHANNTYPADFIYDNLIMESNVIHAAHQSDVQQLLFLGSSCIYPREAEQPMQEEALLTGPLEPTNEPYAIAKIAGIKLCESYNRQHGRDYRSVMPTNLYGPGDNYDLETSHVIPALLRKFHLAKLASQGDVQAIELDEKRFGPIPDEILNDLGVERREPTTESQRSQSKEGVDFFNAADAAMKKNKPLCSLRLCGEKPLVRIWGSGTPMREFLHVDDMASACVHAMNLDHSTLQAHTNPQYSHINIGTGQDCTIRELAETIQEVVGYTGQLKFDTSMPDGTPRKLLDVSRLKKLGWDASISLREGLEDAYEWYIGYDAGSKQ